MSFTNQKITDTWRSECLNTYAFLPHGSGNHKALQGFIPVETVHLNLSKWWNWFNEREMGVLKTNGCPLSISLEGFEKLPSEAYDTLGKILGRNIIELNISDCPHVVWNNEIKLLLKNCSKLASLKMVSVAWLDDSIVEQLTVRYQKTLRCVHLERCQITNNAMFQIGRRCSQLQLFRLVCCTRITDAGVMELTKNIHLSYIEMSHNYNLTDKSLISLLGSAKDLTALALKDCLKLTDNSIAALYETMTAWGKKRNMAGSTLLQVSLESNPNFTAQVLLWLSTSAVNMQELDLSDCSALDVEKGMKELYNLRNLKSLTIGPSLEPIDASVFNQHMQYHADNLVSLHLKALTGVDDAALGDLLDSLFNLKELTLQDMPFGTFMTEALCSSIPNISKLHMIGSKIFGDAELRCITSVCLHIKDLTLSRCDALTDAGFVRIVGLKHIQHLSLAFCSRNCTGNIVKLLGVHPLRTLVIDGNKLNVRECFSFLGKDAKTKLTKISMQQVAGITMEDVKYILENFLGCKVFDLTNCPQLSPDYLMSLKHFSPFLSYSFASDFSGFQLSSIGARRYHQYWCMYEQINKHRAARMLQKLRKKYKLRLGELKGLRKERWDTFKVSRVVLVQAVYRRYHARVMVRRKLTAGRRIVRAGRDWLFYLAYLKQVRARRHYKKHLKSQLFRILLKNHVTFQQKSSYANKVLIEHRKARLQRIYFKLLLHIRDVMQEIKFEYSALSFWEMNFMARIIKCWKKVIFDSTRVHQKRSKQFLVCLPLSTLNSTRQLHMLSLVTNFRNQRLLHIAWVVLAKDRLEKKRVDSLEPMAIDHYQKMFFKRMCGTINKLWCTYAKNRIYKREKKKYGDYMYKLIKYRNGCGAFESNMQRTLLLKTMWKKAPPHYNFYTARLLFMSRFIPWVKNCVVFRQLARTADNYLKESRICKSYATFKRSVIRLRIWRVMNKKAEANARKYYYRFIYKAWNEYRIYCHNLEELYVKKYNAKLRKKIFKLFTIAVKISKEIARQLALEIERKAQSEQAFQRAIQSLRKFQAKGRGFVCRKHFYELRIQKLYAIQTLQNFFRTYLARKEYASRLRKRELAERVREDKECDQMKQEEVDMLYYLYHARAATDIQRTFRGRLGRRIAYDLAVEYYRKKLLGFHQENQHTRLHHQAFLRAAYLREQQQHVAATDIQRIARGKLCRLRFVNIKYHDLVKKKAVVVQRWYRCRLAQVKLLAMRRDKYNDLRFREARKKRGSILRMMGSKKRKHQYLLGLALRELGLDPISYNHRWKELWEETKQDFFNFVKVLRREQALFKEHGFNKLNRMLGRRALLTDDGWRLKMQQAVKIVEPGHKYEGYTGTIVRIDDTVQGNPLYEINLDKFNFQTFVRMTTDPLKIYESVQPLAAIDNYPTLPSLAAPAEIFGQREDNDPYYCKKNIYAAWTIQCAYRMYRGRQIVARRRYEHWQKCIARQHSLLLHLSESNSLNIQGFNFAKLLNIRSYRPIKFDEIRHKLKPGRLSNAITKASETRVISKEIELQLKDRLAFLQKNALLQTKDFFATGYERLNTRKKLGMFLSSMYGLFYRSKKLNSGVYGLQGVKYMTGKTSLISGTDRYAFKQFLNSPHVRYHKTSIYQGEWSGIPLLIPLKPHGEGLVMFLDGWGYAKEDKVLYLTIVACRHLNPMDIGTGASDPYCEIRCNGMLLQTSIKWANLNPQYHENFEIDVTNPMAKLNIIVKDKDYFGSDDFMGQIELKLEKFSDGKTYHATYQLRGEDLTQQEEDDDRGEIEIRLRWAERRDDDENLKQQLKRKMLVRLQAWARGLAGVSLLHRLKQERLKNLELVKVAAVKITSVCRMRLAIKELRRRVRRKRSALKIQKRVRIWISRKVFKKKKIRWHMAVRIQTRMRVYLAKLFVVRLKAKIAADLDATLTLLQKNIRRMLAIRVVKKMRKDEEIGRKQDGGSNAVEREPEPVSSWIGVYGVDPEYRLKRNRRITQKLFKRMLQLKYTKFVSRFGFVYLDSYPPRKSEEEILQELQEGNKPESLTDRDYFMSVFIPPFDPIRFHRKEAIESIAKYEHLGILHIASSIDLRRSVDYTVTTIQCAQRQRKARSAYQKMLRVHRSITLFQRIFRRRYEIFYRGAVAITSLFRMIHAKKRTGRIRKERNAAVMMQCAYRCYIARSMMFDFRSVAKLAVLKTSPTSVENHGAEKALEHRSDTFWIANSPEKAEIRVEFGQIENIVEVWLMTSTYSSSPNFVSIAAVLNKKSGYTELIDRHELPLLKENRWYKFFIPITSTKYFMLIFMNNYGDDEHIAVRQIRFIKSKESSATIIRQPVNYVLNPGPTVAEKAEVILRITATGWPLPTYQWYRNEKIIEGATKPELRLSLFCPVYGNRVYRCIRCKMVAKTVPVNAYHIQCGNCSYQFAYKEVEEFDRAISGLRAEEEELSKSRSSLLASKIQMESLNNTKYASLVADATERLKLIDDKLQSLRELRVKLKQGGMVVNNFTDEGVYVCEVTNVRGGSLLIKRKSASAVVLVEKPKPLIVEVIPLYVARKQASRKKWSIYSSILGTFRNGKLEGLVRIRYNDGSFYEGPYLDEDCIDQVGQTLQNARRANHYGIFKLADGRTFEGHNVDNHFDSFNLQTYYRVTMPNGEVYEGMFVDEMYHGVGMYKFSDGSVYEGQWHRGSRFGHGQLRSAEGWNYEGFFDTNRRHRKGVIDYPDGSSYMGDWYYDKITGYGIYITALKDAYRGQVLDGKFHGQGHLLYANGSSYTGAFKDGFRHGKGIFIEKEGNEYYGFFQEDLYHGEMVVKIIIPIEEKGQDNYEIRVGLYEMGRLIKWKSKFSNPIATKQFIHLFKTNRDMFDSVYSMLLAKYLPNLPEGIDGNDKKVKNIVFRIRLEAGMLVGQDALNQARRNIENLLIPYNLKKNDIAGLKKQIEEVSTNMISIDRDGHHLHSKFLHYISKYEKNTAKVEQYWQDDPKQVRLNFFKACRQLYNISTDEYFAFRNYRVVPVFVKKIVDSISYLLSLPAEWRDQQMMLSDSASNGRAGDEEALRLNYHCKLAHVMTYGPSSGASVNVSSVAKEVNSELGTVKNHVDSLKPKKKTLKYFEEEDESKIGSGYNVFDYVNIKEADSLMMILADTRFRSDSYYVESTGVAGPVLVNWAKANYAYISAAQPMYNIMSAADEDKAAAFRFRAQYTKKQDDLSEQADLLASLQKEVARATEELEELEHALVKAKDLLQFIAGRYQFEQNESKVDYYKLLEQKLEEKRDFFNVEVCVQGIVDQVVERHDREKYIKRIQAFGTGQPYVDEDEINLKQVFILDWIREEVKAQQKSIFDSGRTLGYNFEQESTDVTQAYTMQLISLIADIVIGKLNDKYNDLASAKAWISRKGKKIPCRFIYIFAWKLWEEEAISQRDSQAISAWENIFGDKVSCARSAIEARVNNRMSSIARAQGKVWAQHHKQDIAYAESDLAAEFLEMYGSLAEAANAALMIEQQTAVVDGQMSYDESILTPLLRAQTMCFAKLYPDDMQSTRDGYYVQFAQEFFEKYGLTAGTIAFQLLNGLPTQNGEDDLPYAEYAQHWRDFNLEAYEQAGEALSQEMCAEFADLYPLSTSFEAAKMIVNERMHVYMQDEDIKASYTPNAKHIILAYCYAMRNQGLVRASKENLHTEYETQCSKFWQEVMSQTNQFQKGSALAVGISEEDRFAGFRERLLSKYGFIYGYLCYRHEVLTKEIADLQYVDPLDKVLHRVRPSQLKDVLYDREHTFLKQKYELEDELNAVIEKLAAWNSYFGWVSGEIVQYAAENNPE